MFVGFQGLGFQLWKSVDDQTPYVSYNYTRFISSELELARSQPIDSPFGMVQPAGLKCGDRGPIGENNLGDFRFFS